jgi:hypothetical protein
MSRIQVRSVVVERCSGVDRRVRRSRRGTKRTERFRFLRKSDIGRLIKPEWLEDCRKRTEQFIQSSVKPGLSREKVIDSILRRRDPRFIRYFTYFNEATGTKYFLRLNPKTGRFSWTSQRRIGLSERRFPIQERSPGDDKTIIWGA